MPAILAFLKDWNPKKQGWPVLIVAICFTVWELLSTKDNPCAQQVNFLQSELTADRRWKDSALNYKLQLTTSQQESKKKDTVINAYHQATEPYKNVLQKKQAP